MPCHIILIFKNSVLFSEFFLLTVSYSHFMDTGDINYTICSCLSFLSFLLYIFKSGTQKYCLEALYLGLGAYQLWASPNGYLAGVFYWFKILNHEHFARSLKIPQNSHV